MKLAPISPVVSVNGTSREELLKQQIAVMDAARQLLVALGAAQPNGRDYVERHPHGLREAQTEHRARVIAVEAIYNEANAIAEAIA